MIRPLLTLCTEKIAAGFTSLPESPLAKLKSSVKEVDDQVEKRRHLVDSTCM
jgi:hypothetical protein